ncbi:membrane protein [Bacillus sp. JCM 19045]|nr:membrane protein [Bacillus sp. JCM 19045]
MKQLLSVLIFVTGVIYIAFIEKEATFVSVFFKALPMFLLLIYAMINYRTVGKHRAIVIGLFVCMLADIAIAFSFLAGLSIFLLGHVFYVYAFLKATKRKDRSKKMGIPYMVYAAAAGLILVGALVQSEEGLMVAPVVLYIVVITSMGIAAAWTRNRYAVCGSLFFILSDTILAWNLFVTSVAFSHVWIMTTYYGAQFLIATSIKTLEK